MARSVHAIAAASFALVVSLSAGCGKLAPTPSGDTTYIDTRAPGAGTTASDSTSSKAQGPARKDAPAPPPRTDLQLQPLATAQCQQWPGCSLSGAGIFNGTWGDQATCVAAHAQGWAQELAAKGVTVTQAQIDACVARQQLTPCENNVIECIFTGALPDNTACTVDAQCASGYCTFGQTTDDECGYCLARVPAGGDCTGDSVCAIGLICNAVSKKCMSPLPGDAACNADEEICGPGLACRDGVCGSRIPIGAACTSRGLIHYGYYDDCAGGSWCNSETSVCTPFPTAKKTSGLGEACGEDSPCRALYCNPTTKRCEAQLREGDPCSSEAGPWCALGLTCKAGRCETKPVLVCP